MKTFKNSNDWDEELLRYRKNVSSKRLTVVTTNNPVNLNINNPTQLETIPQSDDEFDDNLVVEDFCTSTSTTDIGREVRPEDESFIDGDESFSDEENNSDWVEYQSVLNPLDHVYYNKQIQTFANDEFGQHIIADASGNIHTHNTEDTPNDNEQERKIRSLRRCFMHMDTVARNIELCIGQGQNLGNEFMETFEKLLKDAKAAKALVDRLEEEVTSEGDVVDYLVGWRHLRWNFTNNDAVKYYRACSTRTDHKAIAYSSWHFPEYFSNNPLPPGCNRAVISVIFPKNDHLTKTQVSVSLDETVSLALQKAYAKFHSSNVKIPPITAYTLKVAGQKDYLDENKLIYSYAYIRQRLRDNMDIELSLVLRPECIITPESAERAETAFVNYREQIDTSIHIIDKHTYSELVGIKIDYQDMNRLTHLPMSSINIPFQAKLIGVENINEETLPRLKHGISHISLRATLFHGTKTLSWNHDSPPSVVSETMLWNHRFLGNHASVYSALPREVRIAYLLIGRRVDSNKEVLLGWVCQQLVNYKGELATGRQTLHFWAFPWKESKKHGKSRDTDPHFIYRAPNTNNNTVGIEKAVLFIEYPSFDLPVVSPFTTPYIEANPRVVGVDLKTRLDVPQSQILAKIVNADPLTPLDHASKTILWNCRHYLTDIPAILPKVLQCVNWGLQDYRNEAYRMLYRWATPANPIDAIELLDARYPDYRVREYAVDILRNLTDEDLQMFCLQLVQCLKFEPYHESPLSRFLIERAIQNPYQIGHTLFWHLKAEVHDPISCERFAVLLEELISNVGIFIDELHKQSTVVSKLQKVAEMVVRLKRELKYTDADATVEYHREIEKLNKTFFEPMGKFQIPLNPKLEATTLIVEKCKYMSSKMVPLWLVFKNADENGAPIYIIFKSGDDLRQDLLTLQLLRVMDKLWLQQGQDMRLKPYSCIATGVNDEGEGVGMIEVVMNSDTTSGIQLKYGGGAMGALKLDPLDLFIRENNIGEALYKRAVSNFVRSCAGYCVATYVLGIGDRHNGNIMLTKTGHLFHIDFGHFLGNFKSKFGINRERAAFVFTPEMAFVMGGKDYKKSSLFSEFKKICNTALRVLRANAALLENLFIVMVAAGMPELMKESDVIYLREMLHLDKNTAGAETALGEELKRSLDSTYRRVDNMIHNLRHGLA